MFGFGGARLFTSLRPDIVIVPSGGFHIHHFWYGLTLLAVSGWIGIGGSRRLSRTAAFTYDLGGVSSLKKLGFSGQWEDILGRYSYRS